jgi:hypothetical protein
MNTILFLGTYPGLTESMLSHEVEVIGKMIERHG